MKKLEIKNGLVINREGVKVEFKKSFNLNTMGYVRTVASFANNKGGVIVFGVNDKPKYPIGLLGKINGFIDYDNKEMSTNLQNNLSANVEFDVYSFEQNIDGKNITFGVLEVVESDIKPVICKKNDEKNRLREGAIYFRYNAKDEEIKVQDLINLIQKEKDKEKELWLKTIQKMAKIGINNVGVFNYEGELFAGNKRLVIDKNIIDKIKFIKESHFMENEGAPAFILKGEIKNMDSWEIVTQNVDPNTTHPYEGISAVIEKFPKKKFYITSKDKEYDIKYILKTIKDVDEIEKSPDLFWKNKKGNVKKYSEKYVQKYYAILNNQEKLDSYF